jgi:hypothetical protein
MLRSRSLERRVADAAHLEWVGPPAADRMARISYLFDEPGVAVGSERSQRTTDTSHFKPEFSCTGGEVCSLFRIRLYIR